MESNKTYCQAEYVSGFYNPDNKLCYGCRLTECIPEECPDYEEKEISDE